jgi:hypothetical protein
MEERVLIDLTRLVGATIAAQIRRDGVETSLGQGCKLMPPGIPAFGKSVAEHNQRTRARFGQVHPDPFVSTVRCVTSGIGADLLAAG